MEIRDYLRAIRRWLWMPILVPLVAAGATGFFLERQPDHYQANATVVVPAVSAQGFSTSAAAQYVATFKDVLISQPVVTQVSADTGVPVHDLVQGLTANTATPSSNIITVTYLGFKGQPTVNVVREATINSLNAIAQPQLVRAQNELAAAEASLAQAEANITSWEQSTGNFLPLQEFNTQRQELDQLLLQLQQAKLANDTQRAAALQGIIAQRQQALTTLATQVDQYQALADARTAALAVRDHAQQSLSDAQALMSADQNSNTVSVQDIGRISKLADVIKFAAIALAVALILTLALILLLELMRGRRVQQATVVSVPAHDGQPGAAWRVPSAAEPPQAASTVAQNGGSAHDAGAPLPTPTGRTTRH